MAHDPILAQDGDVDVRHRTLVTGDRTVRHGAWHRGPGEYGMMESQSTDDTAQAFVVTASEIRVWIFMKVRASLDPGGADDRLARDVVMWKPGAPCPGMEGWCAGTSLCRVRRAGEAIVGRERPGERRGDSRAPMSTFGAASRKRGIDHATERHPILVSKKSNAR